MLLDPRNGGAFDLPRQAGRLYVIASTPRTGSNLLSRALWDTGRAGAPKEYLNPMQLRDWEVRLGSPLSRLRHLPLRGPLLVLVHRWDRPRLAAHLDRVRARRTSNGWFGLKLHHHHLRRWDLGDALEGARWVHLRREDRVAQAVSWARALQTGQWAAHQRPWLPPRYDRRWVDGALRRIEEGEAGWARYFASRRIEPLSLTYEQVTSDLGGAVRAVLRHLGVTEVVAAPPAGLTRQADALSEEWARRYRLGR